MNIRSVILSLVLVVPAALLLAFGPRGRATAPSDRVLVRYWEKWTGVEGVAIQALVDRFNDTVGRERGLFVEYNAVSNIEQRLLIATAGDDPPDLAGLVDSRVAQYADQNALLALDDLVREFGIDLGAFKPVWIELCRYDGRLYALPSTPFTIALYYNRALFRDAGLDPDHPPATIAELTAAAARLTRVDARGRMTQLGFTPSPAMLGWWPWVWPYFFDARPWDGRRYAVDTRAGLAAADWLRAMRVAAGLKATLDFEAAAGPIESPENPFLAGRLAMVFQGPWMANWIRNYAPRLDYGVAPFPSQEPGCRNAFASEDVFVLPRGSRRPREAMAFLAWITQQAELEELCRRHGKVSPFRTPRPEFFAEHPNPHVREFDALASAPAAFGFPRMPMWAQVEAELLGLMQTLLRGEAPPAEALSAAQRRVDACVQEYQRMAARRRGGAPRAR